MSVKKKEKKAAEAPPEELGSPKAKKAKVEKPTKPAKAAKALKTKIAEKKTAIKEKVASKGKKDKEQAAPLDPEKKAELKEKKKKLREERRKKDKDAGVFDIGVRAKQVWEEVRRDDCPEEKRGELLKELLSLVKGNVNKIIYAHDTVRVVECLVALGDESIRTALYEELKSDLINLAKSKYANFFVQKLVKYGTKAQRDEIFKVLEGRVADLTKHKIANSLVEACYNDYCNAAQRNRFLQEFFGPEFRHFKEEDARTVVQLMQRHPEKRRDILKHLASNVSPLVTKGCYNHSLVHTVLYNYMIALSHQIESVPAEKERREKERSEFITTLRDVCVHIVHSHDGARLTMLAIWHGSAKDRKAILKSFKTFMVKVAKEEHGYMALLAILDSVDDTKLTAKAIFSELTASDETLDEIISDDHARKVLLFTMVGRNKTYFHPDVIANLAKGDGNAHSKKDSDVRRAELADALSGPLLTYIEKNLDRFLLNNNLIVFLGAVIQGCPDGNSSNAKFLEKLAVKFSQPFTPGDGKNMIESSAAHIFVKKILGKEDFYKKVVNNFDPDTLKNCLSCNRGAFMFVAMTELEDKADAKKFVQDALKPHMSFLKKQSNKGASILLSKLE